MGKQEWLLVVSTRRSWTALSVMVLSAAGWVLLGQHRGTVPLPFACALGALTLASGVIWVRAQQTVFSIRRSLARPAQWNQLLGS